MALHSELDIYRSALDLACAAVAAVVQMRRDAKPVVGRIMVDECFAIVRHIRLANMAADEGKETHLLQLLDSLTNVETALRISRDARSHPDRQCPEEARPVHRCEVDEDLQECREMTERPILFSAPMVRAILDGRKTQTRRVVKRMWGADHAQAWSLEGGRFTYADNDGWHGCEPPICPYGQPGDRLWVRETHAPQADCWAAWHHEMERNNDGPKPIIHYRADGGDPFIEKWRPSIHMPRWASRITLEITAVRVERLQEICDDDCIAEGIEPSDVGSSDYAEGARLEAAFNRAAYERLWESINGAGSWALNPWVWVVEFRRA